jgi:hypothetical protein
MKIMKNKVKMIAIATIAMVLGCTEEFLDTTPFGAVTGTTLAANESGANSLLIAAYSNLDGFSGWDNGNPWGSAASNWTYGSVAGGDAYKGSEANDQPDITPIERHETTPNNPYVEAKWRNMYDGISRANQAIISFNELIAASTDPAAVARMQLRVAEARFLRGFFHFELVRVFGKTAPKYIDETVVESRDQTNGVDILPNIQADFTAAAAGLPVRSGLDDKGRASKGAAQAYLGITYMWQGDYANAKTQFSNVVSSGEYSLTADYFDNFDPSSTNNSESILEVQQAVNEGTGGDNGNIGDVLNYPYNGGPGGCCGFHQPSQNLVNAYKTDPSGLPYLDTYATTDAFITDQGIPSATAWDAATAYPKLSAVNRPSVAKPNVEQVFIALADNAAGSDPLTDPTKWGIPKDFFAPGNPAADVTGTPVWVEDDVVQLDPRLDWTVGRRGIPYLDWGTHPGRAWIRDQVYAGPYAPKKNVYSLAQEGTYTSVSGWTKGFNSNNVKLLRYADLLLMLAEAEVETSDLANALIHVNLVRNRAKGSAVVENADNTPAANYKVEPYPSFADQATARKAVRFERRLELGMEGHRFFDLVRWGIAKSEKTTYFAEETKVGRLSRRTYLIGATFQDTDIVFPIPQKAITQSALDGVPTLAQNAGYDGN